MKSIDANIALRVLLKDNPHQERIAQEILSKPTLLLSTVILEMVWVLVGKGWTREQIADAFRGLLDLETLHVPDEDALVWAVDRFEHGGDFADIFHVALSGGASSFATFDQKLERYCFGGPVPIETLA